MVKWPTFKEATRSAVSRRVNWLIWSTIVVILGLVLVAASVDSCLLCANATDGRTTARVRSERAQLRAANRQGTDIVDGDVWAALLAGSRGRCTKQIGWVVVVEVVSKLRDALEDFWRRSQSSLQPLAGWDLALCAK